MKRVSFSIVIVYCIFLVLFTFSEKNLAVSRLDKIGERPETTHLEVAGFPRRVQASEGSESDAASAAATDGETEAKSEESEKSEDLEPFDEVIKDFEKLEGLFTVYRQPEKNTVYLEIKPEQLNRNFFMVATLAAGIGESGLYQGMPIRDFVFQLRQINKTRIDLVVPNTRFRTQPGDPQERSLDRSFSDSVISSFKVKSIHPERKTLLLDISELLMADFAGLSSAFPWFLGESYAVNPATSNLKTLKAFPLNIEIDWVYGFSGGGNSWFSPQTLVDSRGFYLTVRYSLSELPTNNGYRPRLADSRVGHFLDAYQDLTRQYNQDPFVRYIQRWHLQKQDPYAVLSPPKEPIVFWIENNVPLEYREAIREGVLMWNTAFKKIGFINAIEVRQMPDDATWDPADVRYNTIRWFNSVDAGFALGPLRANPLTGEVLDADVLISANMIRYMEKEYRTLAQNSLPGNPWLSSLLPNSLLCNPGLMIPNLETEQFLPNLIGTNHPFITKLQASSQLQKKHHFCYAMELTKQAGFGALFLSLGQNLGIESEEKKIYIHQFLRQLVAHEVGHTLGLRHNFSGSNLLMPEELNNLDITRTKGLVSSVMDYVPVNLAPPGEIQGDYFATQLGPYDEWAIEYAYKPIMAMTPEGEIPELEKIAQRAPEPELSYATDEDSWALLDPMAKPWDLSADPLRYAQIQLDNALSAWEKLDTDFLRPQESYPELRSAFDLIFGYYIGYAMSASTYIGGQHFSREHPDDPGASLPFEMVSVEKQREALALLQQYIFAEDAFNFPPDLINKLAPSRWWHWGSSPPIFSLDYPIYDRISIVQALVLSNLLSSDRLERIQNAELKYPSAEMLTMPELFETLQTGIWSEIMEKDPDSLEISTVRRGLQRRHLNILVNMVLRNPEIVMSASNLLDFIVGLQTFSAPEDARVLARYQLRNLNEQIERTLKKHHKKMDLETKAHLEDVSDRILKALDAPLPAK
jgi:hypothetical protein